MESVSHIYYVQCIRCKYIPKLYDKKYKQTSCHTLWTSYYKFITCIIILIKRNRSYWVIALLYLFMRNPINVQSCWFIVNASVTITGTWKIRGLWKIFTFMRAFEETLMAFSSSLGHMRRHVTRRLIVTHAAWKIFERIFKKKLEISEEMVRLESWMCQCYNSAQ